MTVTVVLGLVTTLVAQELTLNIPIADKIIIKVLIVVWFDSTIRPKQMVMV